jgi:hypothetical protein
MIVILRAGEEVSGEIQLSRPIVSCHRGIVSTGPQIVCNGPLAAERKWLLKNAPSPEVSPRDG